MLNLGWFSTGRGPGSRALLTTVQEGIQRGEIDARILFVFCNRETGEAEGSDLFHQLVKSYSLPLICFSSRRFKSEMRHLDREAWRLEYDREIMKRIAHFRPELCVLAGYMLIVGKEMCHSYNMLNLHPAPPGGPAGTWQEVIWHLIENKAREAGAKMHLATEELDLGPTVTYFTFPIQGGVFQKHWKEIEGRSLKELKARIGEELPLFKLIRQHELARELPLVVATLKAFAEGRLRIENGQVLDEKGKTIQGYCLNQEVNARIKGML